MASEQLPLQRGLRGDQGQWRHRRPAQLGAARVHCRAHQGRVGSVQAGHCRGRVL